MNSLKQEQQRAVIAALVEGNSIRSVERMTGIHRDTIMRLLVRVGNGCQALMDEMMQGLTCKVLQLDEIWAYVGMKQRVATAQGRGREVGDAYTFVALDSDTKLVPCWRVGRRTWQDTAVFVTDLHSRLVNRPQITTDAFQAYLPAISAAWENNVDYATLHKVFASALGEPGRYSPPEMVEAEKEPMLGIPDMDLVSTSHVERQNLTMRMCMRRFTRLTNGFSKKLDNLKAAVALHFAYYNLVRVHRTLRVTPAMEAGIVDDLWTLDDLLVHIVARS